MKIRSKNGETMFYVEKHAKMVEFINGVVEVDDKVGKEMIACGYKQESFITVSTPKRVVGSNRNSTNTVYPKFKV